MPISFIAAYAVEKPFKLLRFGKDRNNKSGGACLKGRPDKGAAHQIIAKLFTWVYA